MKLDKQSARIVIALIVAAGLALVQALLHSHHYYQLTYSRCSSELPMCRDWTASAWFESFVLILLACATWFWNEQRTG